MAETILLYIFLLVITTITFISIPGKKGSLNHSLFGIVLIVIVFGLRYDVGTDYLNYLSLFERWDTQRYSIEYGYRWFVDIIYYNEFPFELLIFFSTLITVLLFYVAILKYSPYPWLSVFLLFVLGIIFTSNNLIRQYISISICFLSLQAIVDKNIKKFVIITVSSIFFHLSAVIYFLAYFGGRIKISTFSWTILLLTTIVLSLNSHYLYAIVEFVAVKYLPWYEVYIFSGRLLETKTAGLDFRLYFEAILIPILAYVFSKKMKSNTIINASFNLFGVGILLRLAFADFAALNRLASYFYVFGVIALPSLLYSLKNKNNKLVMA
ncbi:MAG: EpsG family protein, partial [Candidatus Paceibacterota bacterium]